MKITGGMFSHGPIIVIRFTYQDVQDYLVEDGILKQVDIEADRLLEELAKQEPGAFYEWLRGNGWIKKPA